MLVVIPRIDHATRKTGHAMRIDHDIPMINDQDLQKNNPEAWEEVQVAVVETLEV